jgi:plasmid stabilization system protein ParE
VKVLYRQAAGDDIVRQFRYYLLTVDAPEIAVRFREAVRRTIQSLSQKPHVGPRYSSSNPRLQNLRSWPVAGFEAIRIYYALEADAMHIIRILHGKRDVSRILQSEST